MPSRAFSLKKHKCLLLNANLARVRIQYDTNTDRQSERERERAGKKLKQQ